MQDGVPENFTAAMLDPYCDGHGRYTDNSGISFVPVETLMPAAVQLDAAGFQLHFHAIGDRAVRECLDAVEGAIAANGRRDARHHTSPTSRSSTPTTSTASASSASSPTSRPSGPRSRRRWSS